MTTMLKKFMKDERGMETVEYAVMIALIIAALVGAIIALRGAIVDRFGAAEGVISTTE